MVTYDIQAAQNDVAEINARFEDGDDPRESYRLVQERIAACKTRGEEIPEELARLERVIFAECNAESQGR